MDQNTKKLLKRCDKLLNRIDKIDSRIQKLGEKTAVIRSELDTISGRTKDFWEWYIKFNKEVRKANIVVEEVWWEEQIKNEGTNADLLD